MRYFPAFYDIKDRRVVIAGGGSDALRKARLLRKAKPKLTFISEEFEPSLREEFLHQAAFVTDSFMAADLSDRPALVVVATGSAETDRRVANLARKAGVPVNVVDRPELSDFVVPSLVERGDLVVGISTGGNAPVLGRSIRAKIEALLPQRLSDLIDFAGSLRDSVADKLQPDQRRPFWERFFSGSAADLVLSGHEEEARTRVLNDLDHETQPREQGFVHIVGAGPGDPELLTLKALRILQEADVVLYDNLVTDEILELIRRDADRIYVGKKQADHTLPQKDIAELMIKLSREGKKVVRLKGGDPFIFGRGGEELAALKAEDIPAQVVPGITAATGCGATASVPLTHRDHAQAVTFVTGHAKGDTAPDLDWHALAALGHTLVVYMGVGTAALTSANLLRAGLNVSTPVAIIEKGTTPDQKILRTDITRLPTDIVVAGIKGPAVLVIGEVARNADGAGLIEISTPDKLSA